MRPMLFVFVLVLLSCASPDTENSFFNTEAITYNEALNQGFRKIPVDVYRLEKAFGAATLSLEYSNDQKDLLTMGWQFDRMLQKSSLDSLVYGNDMNYLTNPCAVDTTRQDFYLIDKKNRIFVGHSFNQVDESYTEITYYIPKK